MLNEYETQQPIAYKVLSNAVATNHFAHAYIFETNGYEKGLDMALCFAKVILCPHHYMENSKCDQCFQCHMIDDNNYLELKIINPDGQFIKKEQLVDLQDEFSKKSLSGNKVYIINHADKLNNNSANALLKFIEEPPEGIVAILVVDNVYQLLDTIISRCQLISLNGQANVLSSDNTLNKISKLLNNSTADYEEFIANDSDSIDKALNFVKYYEKNGKKVLSHMNEYWFDNFSDKDKIYKAIQIIIYFYKDCLNFKIGLSVDVFDDYIEFIKDVCIDNEVSDLVRKLRVLTENNRYLTYNANTNLLMDRIIITMEEGA